jgi:hypothetical protein
MDTFSFAPGFSQMDFASTGVVAKAGLALPQSGRPGPQCLAATSWLTAAHTHRAVDISKFTKASHLSERVMQTVHKIAIGTAAVFSAFAFAATPGSADTWSPATVPPGHYCVSYDGGGTDCSFTSYAQCEAMASGQDAECFGNTPADDKDPWNTRAQQRPRF